MMAVIVFFLLTGLIYMGMLFYFLIGIFRIANEIQQRLFSVTVLIPARNEEKNISRCIESLWNQTYPREWYRVIIIDDQSTDRTAEVVEQVIQNKPNFQLLRHPPHNRYPTFKKQALLYALKNVHSQIVMTIDADSIAQPDWIKGMVGQYDDDTGVVAGLVTFHQEYERSVFHRLQTLEFAGIVFCGVGAVGQNNPLICNGSNLSYRLQTFHEAGGYDGNEFVPSGDDDLFIQNVHKKTAWKIKYSLLPETINYTRPVNTLLDFINQRARWASKSLYYPQRWLFFLMLMIYFYYLLLVVFFPLTLLQVISWKIYLLGLSLKMVPEFFIVNQAMKVLKRRPLMKYFSLAQIFQILYVVIVGFLGFIHKYTWKGHSGGSAKKNV